MTLVAACPGRMKRNRWQHGLPSPIAFSLVVRHRHASAGSVITPPRSSAGRSCSNIIQHHFSITAARNPDLASRGSLEMLLMPGFQLIRRYRGLAHCSERRMAQRLSSQDESITPLVGFSLEAPHERPRRSGTSGIQYRHQVLGRVNSARSAYWSNLPCAFSVLNLLSHPWQVRSNEIQAAAQSPPATQLETTGVLLTSLHTFIPL